MRVKRGQASYNDKHHREVVTETKLLETSTDVWRGRILRERLEPTHFPLTAGAFPGRTFSRVVAIYPS